MASGVSHVGGSLENSTEKKSYLSVGDVLILLRLFNSIPVGCTIGARRYQGGTWSIAVELNGTHHRHVAAKTPER